MTSSPAPSAPPVVHAIRGWRLALLRPVGWLVRAWAASLRFETTAESLAAVTKGDEAVAFVLWHNRLFLVSEIHRRYRHGRKVYGLVSASKDGAWLDAFFLLVGIHSVRGSSSKLGREALHALSDKLRQGHDIGITPDGPRGPLYDFKAGGLIAARRAHAPLLLLGGAFESAWQLRSWDRFYLPKPFSRVRIYARCVPSNGAGDRDEAVERLKSELLFTNPDHGLHAPPVIV